MSLRIGFQLALITMLLSCSKSDPETAAPIIKPVKLVTVESASTQRDLTFPAVIRALKSAELTFQVPGEVVELSLLEGAEVNEGDVIARLDQRDARNTLAQAQAEYDNALSEYQRALRLAEQDAISRSTVEGRETQRNISKVVLDTAKKAFSDTVIRAPFAGSISQVFVEQFQNIQAKEAIATLQSHATEAIVDIPGTIVARMPQLDPVNPRVFLDAVPDIAIPAEFREASGVADQNTQTYKIAFTFEPPQGLFILPGMTASVQTTFTFDEVDKIVGEGMAVPLAAILAEDNQRFVWVVDEAMRISKRPVQIAPDIDESVTVTQGLSSGETIVAAGVSFLHEGMTVSAWTPE